MKYVSLSSGGKRDVVNNLGVIFLELTFVSTHLCQMEIIWGFKRTVTIWNTVRDIDVDT